MLEHRRGRSQVLLPLPLLSRKRRWRWTTWALSWHWVSEYPLQARLCGGCWEALGHQLALPSISSQVNKRDISSDINYSGICEVPFIECLARGAKSVCAGPHLPLTTVEAGTIIIIPFYL